MGLKTAWVRFRMLPFLFFVVFRAPSHQIKQRREISWDFIFFSKKTFFSQDVIFSTFVVFRNQPGFLVVFDQQQYNNRKKHEKTFI